MIDNIFIDNWSTTSNRNLRKRNYVLIDWFILVDQTQGYYNLFSTASRKTSHKCTNGRHTS